MTFKRNYCEGTSGTGITLANSVDNSSGDALAVSTDGTRTYTDTWANHGTTSWQCSGTSGLTSILGFTITAAAGLSTRCYFRVPALPGSTCAFLQMRTDTDLARGTVAMRTDGKLEVTTQGGVAYTTTMACSTDTTYRIEWRQIKGTTTSNGTVGFKIFAGESASPLETYETSSANTGTNDLVSWRLGKLTGIASTFTILFDDVAMEDQGTAYLGPMLGDAVIVYEKKNILKVNTTGSVGTRSLSYTSGPAVTISEPTTGVFEAIVSDQSRRTKLSLQSVADTTVTQEVIVPGMNLTNMLVCLGGDSSDLANWQLP